MNDFADFKLAYEAKDEPNNNHLEKFDLMNDYLINKKNIVKFLVYHFIHMKKNERTTLIKYDELAEYIPELKKLKPYFRLSLFNNKRYSVIDNTIHKSKNYKEAVQIFHNSKLIIYIWHYDYKHVQMIISERENPYFSDSLIDSNLVIYIITQIIRYNIEHLFIKINEATENKQNIVQFETPLRYRYNNNDNCYLSEVSKKIIEQYGYIIDYNYVSWKNSKKSYIGEEMPNECCVCSDQVFKNHRKKCGHYYHFKCGNNDTENRCPLCRNINIINEPHNKLIEHILKHSI